jgi:hypothetical protein
MTEETDPDLEEVAQQLIHMADEHGAPFAVRTLINSMLSEMDDMPELRKRHIRNIVEQVLAESDM